MSARAQERLALAVVIALLIAVPTLAIAYDHHLDTRLMNVPGRHGTVHVYHITGVARPGMWTLDTVAGDNYWRRTPKKLKEIKVWLGDTLVLKIGSADVEHGFVIPALGIGPYRVEPGQFKVIRYVCKRAGSFPFLCSEVCSCTGTGFACNLYKKEGHEGMTGVLTVEEHLGPPNVTANVTISEDKGFTPDTIKVHQNDIVQINVHSTSNGIGKGVGFCITNYETKVDLQGIAAGDSRSFKFRADKPGSFIIYSSTAAGPKINAAMGSFIVTPAKK
ncbi:MAG TPA: hypothetical protein VFJ58_10015 [Armatimonadota bacterium]|nr:hypothetical protein [Armatimonadota bacterium]